MSLPQPRGRRATRPAKLPTAKELDPADVARAFLVGHQVDGLSRLRYWRGEFRLWIGNAYREIPAAEVRAKLVIELNRKYRNVTTTVTTNVLDQVKAIAILPGTVAGPAWLSKSSVNWPAAEVLVVGNGLLHLPSINAGLKCLRAPTPRFFSKNALDYDFAADAPEPRNWLAFLHQLWEEDEQSIETLQDWFGYCLTADTRQQKILLLLGPKRSGKGTIARVLRAMLGPSNVAGPTLSGLATTFGLHPLLGKTLAIIADARLSGRTDQAIVVERLLSISGEDAIEVEGKYRDSVTCKLHSRLMIVSNELPSLADSSGALAGRMILLKLKETFFGREDHQLTDRLLRELPGILLWAVAGWRRLRQRGRFVQPDSGDLMLADLGNLTSPMSQFVREKCVVGPEYHVEVEVIYHAFVEWCRQNGRYAPNQQVFGRDISAALPSLKRAQPRDSEGGRYRIYEGVGLLR